MNEQKALGEHSITIDGKDYLLKFSMREQAEMIQLTGFRVMDGQIIKQIEDGIECLWTNPINVFVMLWLGLRKNYLEEFPGKVIAGKLDEQANESINRLLDCFTAKEFEQVIKTCLSAAGIDYEKTVEKLQALAKEAQEKLEEAEEKKEQASR